MIQETERQKKRMAIIPWSEEYAEDKLFDTESKVNSRDNVGMVFLELKRQIEEHGWSVHTIDCYNELTEINLIVFFCFNIRWYQKLKDLGMLNRTVYMAWEPPVVDPNHTKRSLLMLRHYFRYILTWNDSLIGRKWIYKFMYPYWFESERSAIPFDQKDLLVNISGNKYSDGRNELYSERKKVIEYFDGRKEFALYGTRWEKENYRSYRGIAPGKKSIYHQFRFALSLENMSGIDGYITEKILDCLCAGIVPIYLGARNIDRYIPRSCYISYDRFNSLKELDTFLTDMSEAKYQQYLDNAELFLQSEQKNVFLVEHLVCTLLQLGEKRETKIRLFYPLWVYHVYVLVRKVFRKTRRILCKRKFPRMNSDK